MARQRQTSREAGAQSHGPLVGRRAAERRLSDSRCHPRGKRDSSRPGLIHCGSEDLLFLPAGLPGFGASRTRDRLSLPGVSSSRRTPRDLLMRARQRLRSERSRESEALCSGHGFSRRSPLSTEGSRSEPFVPNSAVLSSATEPTRRWIGDTQHASSWRAPTLDGDRVVTARRRSRASAGTWGFSFVRAPRCPGRSRPDRSQGGVSQ